MISYLISNIFLLMLLMLPQLNSLCRKDFKLNFLKFSDIFTNLIDVSIYFKLIRCNRIKDDTLNKMVEIILNKIGSELKSFELLYE